MERKSHTKTSLVKNNKPQVKYTMPGQLINQLTHTIKKRPMQAAVIHLQSIEWNHVYLSTCTLLPCFHILKYPFNQNFES